LGLQIGERLLLAENPDQSKYLPNQKQTGISQCTSKTECNKLDLTAAQYFSLFDRNEIWLDSSFHGSVGAWKLGFTFRSQESGSWAFLSRSQESSSGSTGCNTSTSHMISSGGHALYRNYIISMLLYPHKFLPLSIFLILNTISMNLLEGLFSSDTYDMYSSSILVGFGINH